MNKIKLLVVDDHDIIIDGIKAMLINNEEIEIIAEAKDGEEALKLASELIPDVILMDISMPKLSGIEATKRIKSKHSGIKIIVLTQHESKEYVLEMMKVGADGYLLKNSKKSELTQAIGIVHRGEKYFGHKVSSIMMNEMLTQNESKKEVETKVILTKREIEIIKLISNDLSNQEIASELNISLRTVETHRRNLMQKLDVKSVVALVRYALKNNIIQV